MGLSLFSFLRTRARTTPLKRRINQRIIVLQRLVRGARGDSGLWAMDINPETGCVLSHLLFPTLVPHP